MLGTDDSGQRQGCVRDAAHRVELQLLTFHPLVEQTGHLQEEMMVHYLKRTTDALLVTSRIMNHVITFTGLNISLSVRTETKCWVRA